MHTATLNQLQIDQHPVKLKGSISMKSMYFKNKITSEQFICDNPNDVQTIDGIEYLLVRRVGTDRILLMRQDVLELMPTRTLEF